MAKTGIMIIKDPRVSVDDNSDFTALMQRYAFITATCSFCHSRLTRNGFPRCDCQRPLFNVRYYSQPVDDLMKDARPDAHYQVVNQLHVAEC